MNSEKSNIERLRLKPGSFKNISRGYEHSKCIVYRKTYEICNLSTTC